MQQDSIEMNWGSILNKITDPIKRQVMKDAYREYNDEILVAMRSSSTFDLLDIYQRVIGTKATAMGLEEIFTVPLQDL